MKILIPLDGSPTSESALPWAQALAPRLEAGLLLVGVVDPFQSGPTGQAPSMALRLTEHLQSDREKYLQHQASLQSPGTAWKCLMGSPARVLGSLAQPEHCGAVIMASHGRSGGARWFLGSVAESVLRQSGVPVLLVRPDCTVPPTGFARALLPLDGSPESRAFLPRLKPWLAPNAEVLLVRSSGFDAHDYLNVADPGGHQQVLQHMEDELAQVELEGFRVSRHVLDGDAAECIVAMAKEHHCDLVAMSTHGRSGWQRFLLGSVTEKVARRAACPVLAFPQQADRS
jgi:nucleotide-binding universal stress UspA family protein